MRKITSLTVAAVVLVGAGAASGQTPFIDNLVVTNASGMCHETFFQDIGDSSKTVAIPVDGTAVIMWSVTFENSTGSPFSDFQIRPAIGAAFPSEGMQRRIGSDPATDRGTISGSWATAVEAGEVVVRLQGRKAGSGDGSLVVDGGISWTIMVYPDESYASAIGNNGLAILIVLLLGAGSYIMRQRRAVTA